MKKIVGIFTPILGALWIIFVVFFYFFKFHVTTTILDEYRWNKVQELPLSMLSIDLKGESFISRLNKVHHLQSSNEKDALQKDLEDTIQKQMFQAFTAQQYPFKARIKIGQIEITTQFVESCDIEEYDCVTEGFPAVTKCDCKCSADCGVNANKKLTSTKIENCYFYYELDDCIIRKPVVYTAKFPVPLFFNGTDNFVEELYYQIEETM